MFYVALFGRLSTQGNGVCIRGYALLSLECIRQKLSPGNGNLRIWTRTKLSRSELSPKEVAVSTLSLIIQVLSTLQIERAAVVEGLLEDRSRMPLAVNWNVVLRSIMKKYFGWVQCVYT